MTHKAIVLENREPVTEFRISGPFLTKASIKIPADVELHDSGYFFLEQLDSEGNVRKSHDVINIDGYRFGIDVTSKDGKLILRVFSDEPHKVTCYSESCQIDLPRKNEPATGPYLKGKY